MLPPSPPYEPSPTPPSWPVNPGQRPVDSGDGPPSTPRPRSHTARAVVAGFLAAALLGGGGYALGRLDEGSTPASRPAVATTVASPAGPKPLSGSETEPAAAVAQVLSPAVVQLETQEGLGSGFVYDKSGLILTAAHVVGNTDQIRVRTADGTSLDGKVLGSDTASDVAVVKVDAKSDLTVAKLATDQKIEVGQTAIAIGSPFGLDQTVTAGIVSAVGRSTETPGGAIPMIQTDAPINPGNSGGALADRYGRVIGINDSIAGASGGNVGVGFAIPIDTAKQVADRIVDGKPIETAILGVSGADSRTDQNGALVLKVESGSGAADAGVAEGDLITEIDGKPVRGMLDLTAGIRSHQPGDSVELKVVRDGNSRSVKVKLGR